MGSLIKFELRKIVSKRVTQVSCGVIFVLLLVSLYFNISSQYALDPNNFNTELVNTAAIAQIKENADALAGPITNEKATADLREYKTFIGSDGEILDQFRADTIPPGERADEYWKFNATHNAYMGLIVRPWMNGYQMPVSVAATIDTSNTVGLYGQIQSKIQQQLNGGSDSFEYSDTEKDFWTNKAKSVATPIEYGYSGGWKDFLDLAQSLIFALLAVVITCASVFNVEYREKTDAVLLSTRYGKTRLGSAKVIAAIIAASVIYWIMALVMLVVPLIFFGADGAGLPIQATKLLITYSTNMFVASITCCLIGYVAMLGLLGIVLALSSRMKSSMGILAVSVAIVLIPVFIPNLQNSLANHILFLFPFFALDPSYLFDMVSYAVGPVVIEYPMMLMLLYAVLFIGGSLIAVRSFKKHQVA